MPGCDRLDVYILKRVIKAKTEKMALDHGLLGLNFKRPWRIFGVGSMWNAPCWAKVWPLLITLHSFVQVLSNQKPRTLFNWLLIGLNLHLKESELKELCHRWQFWKNWPKFFKFVNCNPSHFFFFYIQSPPWLMKSGFCFFRQHKENLIFYST